MSESIAQGRGVNKTTCRKCNRTVYVVIVDGQRIETDTELIHAIVRGQSEVMLVRRVHAELCARYEAESKRVRRPRRGGWW